MKKLSDILQEDPQLFALTKAPPKKLSKPKAKTPAEPRNYRKEVIAAQASLFDAMVDFRAERRSGVSHELVQIAHALILCGLPALTDLTNQTVLGTLESCKSRRH